MAGIVRIGIDVGGTFTHAVAIDGDTLEILGKSKVPTTHSAAEGVAGGIIQSLQLLLKKTNIDASAVGFIAHSTTQATNALLEGDVATVGIIGMGSGPNAILARGATNIKKLELAPGKFMQTYHRFLDTSSWGRRLPTDSSGVDAEIKKAIEELRTAGATTIAASEAFSVDEPDNEERVAAIAREMGFPATTGSEISQMYGLKVRTRTAVINASMLPKMIDTANMTEHSVRAAGITAPIMIMRSDGGVMDIDAMRKRPILTMLSGPAAGVAAAMMYLHISDGIFLEVGGTSTDISAIRNGRALVKSAEVGGHKVYMRTLDVRTVGVAGGSIPRLQNNSIADVGPRSAHIAALKYASFSEPLVDPRIHLIQPRPTDPSDYLAFSEGEGKPSITITPTCAANLLGLVPPGDPAQGRLDSIRSAFAALEKHSGIKAEESAESLLLQAHKKNYLIVRDLIREYKLDQSLVTLVGGGGGAAAIVPFMAKQLDVRHSLAQNADVVSAIGVALALVRETIERQVVNPSSDEILRIRQEAHDAVQRMGADPSTIDIHIEVDSRTNTIRATASGATKLSEAASAVQATSSTERKSLAADSLRLPPEQVSVVAESDHYQVFAGETVEKQAFGLFRHKCRSLRTIDSKGIIRLQNKNGDAVQTTAADAENSITAIAEKHATYGDAGKVLPELMLLAGAKVIDLSGLMDLTQVLALARIELETVPRDSRVIVIADLR